MLVSKCESTLSDELPSITKAAASVHVGCSIHQLKSRDKYSAVVEIVNNCPVFGFLDELDAKEIFLQEVFTGNPRGQQGSGTMLPFLTGSVL